MRDRPDEITSEMREAGSIVLQELWGVISFQALAERVYTAMVALRGEASRQPLPAEAQSEPKVSDK